MSKDEYEKIITAMEVLLNRYRHNAIIMMVMITGLLAVNILLFIELLSK